MMNNYPPGVTGNEPEIVGDIFREEWEKNLKVGDECLCFPYDKRVVVKEICDLGCVVSYIGVPNVFVMFLWEDLGPIEE